MNKDSLIIFFLSFFMVIMLGAVYSILKSNTANKVKSGTIRNYKPGAFSIEGPDQVNVNIPFNLKFVANSQSQTANAVALEVTFDPKTLEVINVDTSKSFCQFYPQNRFNNTKGTISIHCGSPHPGFKGENAIASIQFLPRIISQTTLRITDKSLILISDGKGSNIFNKPIDHTISILNNI